MGTRKKKLPVLPPLKPVAECGVCGSELYNHFGASDCPRRKRWNDQTRWMGGNEPDPDPTCPLSGIGWFNDLKSRLKANPA